MTELLKHSKKAFVNYDDVFKAVLAGDSKVGKSQLLARLVEDQFTSDYSATVGVDFGSKTVRSKSGKRMKLQLWDTSGQERFHSVTTAYFPGAHAILLVYDVTNPKSFEHLQHWARVVETNCEDGVVLLVVGNKVRLNNLLYRTALNLLHWKMYEELYGAIWGHIALFVLHCTSLHK